MKKIWIISAKVLPLTYKLIKHLKFKGMKLLSKITTARSFWVEDYNQQEKVFFLSLGFRESKFGDENVLDFKDPNRNGYEFWTIEQYKRITDAVKNKFSYKQLPIKRLGIHDML